MFHKVDWSLLAMVVIALAVIGLLAFMVMSIGPSCEFSGGATGTCILPVKP